MSKRDLIGHKFGRYLVMNRAQQGNRQQSRWLCRCDCGTTRQVDEADLLRGHAKSCGCLARELSSERAKHRLCNTRSYMTWKDMRGRCNNPRHKWYGHYGGRGIIICERWNDFKKFFSDMGERPKGMSIDRIDNNKGYYPKNCRWATPKVQSNNKDNSKKLTEAQVREIRKSDSKFVVLAQKYSVRTNTISRIKHYRTWKYVA